LSKLKTDKSGHNFDDLCGRKSEVNTENDGAFIPENDNRQILSFIPDMTHQDGSKFLEEYWKKVDKIAIVFG